MTGGDSHMRRQHAFRPFLWALILSLALVGSAVTPATAAAGASIAGTVTGPDAAPAEGVYAAVFQRYVEDEYDEWEVYKYVKTDAAGAYQVGSLPAGTYRLGFIDESVQGYLTEYWDDQSTVEAAADITVSAGQAITGKDAQLGAGGHIAGTVTGPGGQAAPGVLAAAYLWYDNGDDGYWDLAGYVETDADGHYDIGSLPTATYRVGFSDFSDTGYLNEYWDDAEAIDTATDIDVAAGETTSGKDAQLAEGGHITGTVTGPHDEAAAEIEVVAYRWTAEAGWEWAAYADTGPDGRYSLNGLPTGTYRIGFSDYYGQGYLDEYWDDAETFETATDIDVVVGETAGGKDAQLSDGGHITGAVTGPGGGALAGVYVAAYRWDSDEEWWDQVAQDETDGSGAYDLAGLPTGTYRIGFHDGYDRGYLTEYWNDAASIGRADDIAVTAEQTVSGRNAELSSDGHGASHVSGTVTGPGGRLLDGIAVRAYRRDPTTGRWGWTGSAVTDTAGGYDLAVPAGDYKLYFDDFGGAYVGEYWDNAATVEAATTIQVGIGSNITGRSPQLAAAAASPMANLAAPEIMGAAQVGVPVPASPGAWNPGGWVAHYQWLVAGIPVPGATDPTYTPTAADVGKQLQVRVIASASGHGDGIATSAVRTVGKGTLKATKKPRVTGKAKRNATLRVTPGAWSPSKVSVTYKWYAGAKALPKATTAKLKLAGKTLKAVAGKAISVLVTVSAPGYGTVTTKLKVPGKAKLH